MDRRNERGKAPEKAGGGKPAFSGAGASAPGGAGPGRRFCPEERAAILRAYAEGEESMDALCARVGLSTATLCKWRRWYAAGGEAGLLGRPRPERRGKQPTGPARSEVEKREAVAAFAAAGMTRRAFAAAWGVNPKTLAAWLRRYGGEDGAPTPARRGRPPGSGGAAALPAPVTEAVAETKRRYPFFGLRRIRDYAARFLGLRVTRAEVRRTLVAEGLDAPVVRRRRPSRPLPRRFERSRPGELWQSDITSFVLPRPKLRVYLTVYLDDCSRYVVSFGLKTEQRAALVTEALREGIARYGKPKEILTDQGRQYYAWRGKCDFQKLLLKEGIQHVVARAHHPQTVGKCERLWSTVKDEFFDRVRVEDVAEARERLGCWFGHYNFTRPHQSLDGLVPADRFFAAEDPVRRAIEATLSNNELRRAIGEKPRTPVYLAGRIGDQTVSLHGEGGRLVVHTGEGDERAIEMASLGMPGTETSDDADRDDGTTETGTPPAAGEVRDAGPRGVGAGAVAVGDGGGADQGPRGGGGDPVVVAGGDAQGGGGDDAGGDAAAAVAAQPAGAVGDGGGIAQTAEEEKGGGNEPGEPGGEPGPAEEDDRHAHHGAAAGAGGGDPPAADAGVADGGGGDQERWIQAFLDTLPEWPRRPGSGWGAGSASRDAASGGPTSPEASA